MTENTGASTRDFLEQVFAGLQGYTPVAAFSGGGYGLGQLNREEWFELPVELPDMADYVERNGRRDLYFSPMVFDVPRRRQEHATYTRCVWADADDCPPERFAVAPSLTVQTSPDRHQCYWLLSESVEAEEAAGAARRIAYTHAVDGCDTGGWDVGQLLRVPGSMHTKRTPFPVHTSGATGELHTLAALQQHYPYTAAASAEVVRTERESAPERLPAHIRRRLDEEPGDRSAQRWEFILCCAQMGYSDGQILTLLDSHRPTRQRRSEQHNRDWDLLESKQIAKARTEHGHAGRTCGQAACGAKPDWMEAEPDVEVEIEIDPDRPRNIWGMPLIKPELTYDVSEALNHLRQAAHADLICPDQVLHSTLDMLAAYTTPKIMVDTGMRRPIQPHKATAIVGPPGTGKGAGRSAAKKILPFELWKKALEAEGVLVIVPHPSTEHPSTGEGLVESYFTYTTTVTDDGKTKKEKKQVPEGSCHFFSEEAQDFVAQGERNASTLFPNFRKLVFDDPAGQSGASVETRRKVAESTYRAVFTMGFQPHVFGELLSEEHIGIGTPQRFDVCAAAGVKLPEGRTPHPDIWEKALLTAGLETSPEVTMSPELKDEIYNYERSIAEGTYTEQPLRVHRTRRIVSRACLIALLEGTTFIDRRIWDIAVELFEASVAAMHWILSERKRLEDKKRDELAHAKAHTETVVDSALEDSREQRAIAKGAQSLARRVHKLDGEVSRAEVTKAVRGEHRKVASVDQMVDYAVEQNWIVRSGEAFIAGEEEPPKSR